MYVPASFADRDPTHHRALMRARPFATLITVADGEPFATHVPLVWVDDGSTHGALRGHLARANPQWRHFDGGSTLAIFGGPHAYVSARDYASPGQVPTWNYVAVHAYGRPRVADHEGTRDIVRAIVDRFEEGREAPWTDAALDPSYLDDLLRAVVAFELPIARLEAKWKVGQNRAPADREAAASALLARDDPDARAIGEWMRAVGEARG